MNIQTKSAQNKRTQPDNEDVQNPEQRQKAKKPRTEPTMSTTLQEAIQQKEPDTTNHEKRIVETFFT